MAEKAQRVRRNESRDDWHGYRTIASMRLRSSQSRDRDVLKRIGPLQTVTKANMALQDTARTVHEIFQSILSFSAKKMESAGIITIGPMRSTFINH